MDKFPLKTKYPIKKMVKLASDGIIGFSTKPLKLVGSLGIISIINKKEDLIINFLDSLRF